jgi:hypothetical protein
VPDVVDAVVLRALRKDPMERYANVSQLGQALENAAAAASIQSRNRRQTPSSAPIPSAYRVVAADVGRATTDPSPSYLEELRARNDARPPASSRPSPQEVHERARRLAAQTREAMAAGALDEAVERGEQLFDLAIVNQNDSQVLEIVRTHLSLLDRIFAQRLGALDCKLVVSPTSERAGRPELAPAALALIEAAASGLTVREILDRARMPRRDAIRVLAGLLRRRMLTPG